MPDPQTRTEYRVVGESPISFNGVRSWTQYADDIAVAHRVVNKASERGNSNVRVQQRTITETPWTDVEGSGMAEKDPRCSQGKESLRQRHRRVMHEYAELRRMERQLGDAQFKRLLINTPSQDREGGR